MKMRYGRNGVGAGVGGSGVRPALRVVAFACLLGAFPAAAGAQATPPPSPLPEAVTSLDGVLAALYDVISGPAGVPRDWARFHGLFLPDGARLVPTGAGPQGPRHQVWTPEQYATTAGPQLEAGGFFEREIGRVTERFGNVVHVFSAYESRRTPADREPFARGINSIQLFHDGTRYWIVTIFWDSERPDNPIPQRYLGG